MTRVLILLLTLLMLSGAIAADPLPAYKVGPEDTINVSVARHPEFSGEFLIPSDGVINLPAVGRVTAAGKSLTELVEEVTAALRKRLQEPEVSVTLKSAREQRVYVLGFVEKPGSYDSKPGWRVTEAVAAAGGLTPGVEASECSVTLTRSGTEARQIVQMADALNGLPDANPSVESGDVLTIQTRETFPVYVTGKVRNPGLYRIRKDSAGILAALTMAGGTTEDAAVDRVKVTHVTGTSETLDVAAAVVRGGEEPKVVLQPGDLVVVPEETARIAVLGHVNQPGFHTLQSGHTVTLSDALGMAGGIEKRGASGSVAIIRTVNGKQERMMVDMHKFLKSGDSASNPTMQAGDVVYVPETRKPDWDFLLRAFSSIGMGLFPFTQ